MTLKRVVKEVVLGVVEGLAMYFVFVIAVPWIVSTALKIPVPENYAPDSPFTVFTLGVFITLGILSSVVKPPIGIVFEVLSTAFALAILLRFFGPGVFRETIEYGGTVMDVEFDIRVLFLFFAGFTLLNCVIRVFEKLTAMED